MKLDNRLTNILATVLLTFVFLICFFSVKDDSLTMDEVAHLPAGYSYLTQKDMRINPEHPPLIKDLAAFPLLFIQGIKFPSEIKAWKEDVNGQWDFGFYFMYRTGNPADKMIFWGRIPMMLILILLGFYIFKWTKEFFGNKTALLALFLFSFSPTFLAHGRLVTTDVAAATGVFIASYYFLEALKNPNKRNIIFSGMAFGLAELCKFSVILLIPLFAILILVWVFVQSANRQQFFQKFILYALYFILVLIIGYLFIIWPVYQYHVLNYPPERQLSDTKFILTSQAGGPSSIKEACFSTKRIFRCPAEMVIWMADKPILRALGHYFLGLLMVFQRATGSHTTYFLGEISAAGWKNYFPVVYAIKEPLPFHILTIISLLYAGYLIKQPFWQNPIFRLKEWIKSHFPEFTMFTFLVIYWATSLDSDLNIGVRHLLPVFPFTFILVSVGITNFLKGPYLKFQYILIFGLILWQAISVISIYPHFLSYFNEIIGGPDYGYIYTVDSNLDWGQDLKRLKKWVEENKIKKIYVDYFGGSNADYYLKEKFAPWWGTRNPEDFPKGNYLAVSATFLQGGRGEPAPGSDLTSGYYRWLDNYQVVTKIGYSIFVYYIE